MKLSRSSVAMGGVLFLFGTGPVCAQQPGRPASGRDEPMAPAGREARSWTAQQIEMEKRVEQAMSRTGRGDNEEAMAALRQVLREDPNNKRARFGLGTIHIQMGNYREALDILEPMTEEFPDDFFVKNNVAWLYATARDPAVRDGARAIRYAQEALLIEPDSYHVWNTLSESYFISGDYDKARRAAEEALKLATQAGAPQSSLMDYRRQVEKSRRAARAMSLLD